MVSPSGSGSVSGGGFFVAGTQLTVRAYANSGWEFVNWTDGNGAVVSTNNSYTFTKGAGNETLTANFSFNPDSPGEPAELPQKLTLVAGEGGSVSGGGYYRISTVANIRAYAYSNFEFDGWYNADGTLYSSNASTTYTMGDEPVTLTARFMFNPDSPSEPDEVNAWRLKLTAQDGGTVWAGKYLLKEGETTTVRAYPNTGYVFVGWYQEDVLISEVATFDYTMGGSSVTLEARFLFSPNNPDEPGYIEQRKFSFTLKNVITKPGTTAQFPILLTPLGTLGDMTFQLNFDPRLNVDIDNVAVGETTTAYTLTREAVTEGDAAYDEAMTSYRFTLSGGSMVVGENEVPTVTPILTFPVIIPVDMETAASYKISINQISMTLEDGNTQTAGTRNGRVSVYKLGDTNGDNTLNILDAMNLLDYIFQDNPKTFIKEVSDIDESNTYNIADFMGIIDLIFAK